jgi:predicted small secreted protein
MKRLIAISLIAMLTACSTVGGAVGGFGKDVKAGTDWVQGKLEPTQPAK